MQYQPLLYHTLSTAQGKLFSLCALPQEVLSTFVICIEMEV